jgi:hypothetical protein
MLLNKRKRNGIKNIDPNWRDYVSYKKIIKNPMCGEADKIYYTNMMSLIYKKIEWGNVPNDLRPEEFKQKTRVYNREGYENNKRFVSPSDYSNYNTSGYYSDQIQYSNLRKPEENTNNSELVSQRSKFLSIPKISVKR